jgi:peptide deformylase
MVERPIRIFGDPVLTSATQDIAVIDDGVRALVQDLLDTVALPGRAGVAATQIGVGLRAFSYNVNGDVGYILNPRIVDVGGELTMVDEGCLSVPGLWFKAPRHEFAKVEGINLDGEPVTLEGRGLMAQALQHETDHLDGMLYLSRLEPETRREAMKQVRASDWF